MTGYAYAVLLDARLSHAETAHRHPHPQQNISVQTAVTLLDVQSALQGQWDVQVRFHSASVISDLRNLIAAHFLASDRDVLFMLDADQGYRCLPSGECLIPAIR